MMMGLFYQFHPLAVTHPLRSRLAMGLLWIWAVRMTHSYFRRWGAPGVHRVWGVVPVCESVGMDTGAHMASEARCNRCCLASSSLCREEWQVGAREDWRYARMGQVRPSDWWGAVRTAVRVPAHGALPVIDCS